MLWDLIGHVSIPTLGTQTPPADGLVEVIGSNQVGDVSAFEAVHRVDQTVVSLADRPNQNPIKLNTCMPAVAYKELEDERAYGRRKYYRKLEISNRAKSKPCKICRHEFPPAAMDLHHIDPSLKKNSINKLVSSGSYKSLEEEIAKCVPLCACCHRLLHAGLVELVL